MGCSSSQQADPSGGYTQQNVFKVTVLDSRGQDSCTGHLEITFQELTLHQLGKDSIHWPLWSLRRYGCDKDLFSFESGRRCPNGPGIYAFRCHQAQALFNLLQLSILWAGQVQENRMSAIPTLDPVVQAAVLNQLHSTLKTKAGSDDASALHNYVNDPAHFGYYNVTQQQQYINPKAIQYADLDLPIRDAESMEGYYLSCTQNQILAKEQTAKKISSVQAHAYVNMGGENRSAYVNVPATSNKGKAYVNVPVSSTKSAVASECPLAASTPAHWPRTMDLYRNSFCNFTFENSGYLATATNLAERQECKTGNSSMGDSRKYMDKGRNRRSLALQPSQPFCLASEAILLEENKCDAYAVIDFDKTLAIPAQNRANDTGKVKKTRHSCDVETMYYC